MSNEAGKPSTESLKVSSSTNSALKTLVVDYVNLVRAKMRDYAELNRLIAGRESSDRDIATALLLALDDWNTTPPLLDAASLTNFPARALLIDGTIIQILQSVGLLQTRNHMQYSDGQGVQVGTSDKAPQLMAWLNMFVSSYEQKKFRYKQAKNLADAMGNRRGVASEYVDINGFFAEIE